MSPLHHFIDKFYLLSKKVVRTGIFTQKWLDHLLRMTSYVVTIVTDLH